MVKKLAQSDGQFNSYWVFWSFLGRIFHKKAWIKKIYTNTIITQIKHFHKYHGGTITNVTQIQQCNNYYVEANIVVTWWELQVVHISGANLQVMSMALLGRSMAMRCQSLPIFQDFQNYYFKLEKLFYFFFNLDYICFLLICK